MKRIGITIGDPNGIGPEIAIKVALKQSVRNKCDVILVGDKRVLEFTAKRLKIPSARFPGRISIIQAGPRKKLAPKWGKFTAESGRESLKYVKKAVELTKQGELDAMVTCPISKEAVQKSGLKHFTGHTEYIAKMCKAKGFAMTLWHGGFRVTHVSCHESLAQAVRSCRKARIIKVGRFLYEAIRSDGIRKPRIGIAGLNPHAGEGGAFGTEEKREIVPAVKQLRNAGINAEGPIPPDIIFARMKGGIYDGVVAMYHDQGHIATKTLFFNLLDKKKSTVAGVNVTLGLPIVRTSVDHGTSFDIAGKGIADPTSLIDAIELANILAEKKKLRPH